MKIKALVITSFLVLFSIMAQAQINVFEKLTERKDVTAVHVSKSLLGMISKMDTGGADIARLADKLKQIDVYTSESSDASIFMKAQADQFAKSKSYEAFMTLKEKNQTVLFYGQKSGTTFKDLVMVLNEPTKCVIIRMTGEFTADDIQKVVKK